MARPKNKPADSEMASPPESPPEPVDTQNEPALDDPGLPPESDESQPGPVVSSTDSPTDETPKDQGDSSEGNDPSKDEPKDQDTPSTPTEKTVVEEPKIDPSQIRDGKYRMCLTSKQALGNGDRPKDFELATCHIENGLVVKESVKASEGVTEREIKTALLNPGLLHYVSL